jgi:hypothetical protein
MELALNDRKTDDHEERTKRTCPRLARWRLKDRDKEALRAAATVSAWSLDARDTAIKKTMDGEAEELRMAMSAAYDAAMPRTTMNKGLDKVVH